MPSSTSTPLTLADVRERISNDESLPEYRRRAVRIALKRLGDILGEHLAAIPAEPTELRKRVDGLHHAQVGLSPTRLATIRSHLTFALKHCGIATFRTSNRPPSPRWRQHFDRLTLMRHRIGLSRFMRFCDERSIRPEDVSDATSEAFRDVLINNSLVRKPEHVHRITCKIWNEAVGQFPEWPRTSLSVPPSGHRYFSHHWKRLPPSFHEEADHYLAWRCGEITEGREPPAEPIGPTTKALVLGHIRSLVAGLAEGSHDVSRLTSLSELVAVENVKEAIRQRINARGGSLTKYDAEIARTALRIARDWLNVSEEHVHDLERVYRQVRPIGYGLSDKSIAALRQFSGDDNVRLILELPDRLMREARRGDHGLHKATVAAQMAVAIEILLSAPMYPCDVAKLKIHRNLQYLDGPKGNLYIVVPGEQSATGRELTFVLTRHGSDLVTEYLLNYLPPAIKGSVPWLFPGTLGSHKNVVFFRLQITETIYTYTGLSLSPFQFRHLAAKLILDRDPHAHEVVRQLLGHSRLERTLTIYWSLDTQNALYQYDKLLVGSKSDDRR